jgi:hypothetical protein
MGLTVPNLEFVRGIPHDLEEDRYLDVSVPNLIIFDDLMGDVAKDKRITELFTKGCHHRNLSVICLVQNFYFPGTITMRRNSHYIVLFNMPGDQKQISSIAYQMFPSQPSRLLDFYRQCIDKAYGYILIDLGPQTPTGDRLKTDIFLGDNKQGLPGRVTYLSETPENHERDIVAKRTEKHVLLLNHGTQTESPKAIFPGREESPLKIVEVIPLREEKTDNINDDTSPMDQTESDMQTAKKEQTGLTDFCPDCGTVFRTPFDLVLHMKQWCPADQPSTKKKRRLEETSEPDEEEHGIEYGFEPLLEAVREELAHEEEEEEDGEEAEAPEPTLQNKLFRAKYRQFLETWYKLQDNPIHEKVMSTIDRLMDNGDYSRDEAIAAALRERKYLFDKLFEEDESSEESEEEEEEEEGSEEDSQ